VESAQVPNPFSHLATRHFRFCVPDEWYRRSKPRSISTASLAPSEATIQRLADLEEEEDQDEFERDGTAKQKNMVDSPLAADSTSKPGSGDWKGTFSQNRLSTFFDGWLPSSNPPHPIDSPPRERMSVSEPKLLDQSFLGREMHTHSEDTSDEDEIDPADFTQLLVRA
jgi:hypothetical protein